MNSNDKLIGLFKHWFAKWEKQTTQQEQVQLFGKMCEVVGTYDSEKVDLLTRMVEFVEENVAGTGHQSKLIKEYDTDQPSGCNGVVTLTYGCPAKVNIRPKRWIARIYFIAKIGPRIGFPKGCLKSTARKVDIGNDAFSPQDRYIEDFFKYPGNYLDWNKLKAR